MMCSLNCSPRSHPYRAHPIRRSLPVRRMRDLFNSRFGGVMGRKLVGDAPDPIVPKRPAPRYGVKVANSAAAPRTGRADA